MKELNLSGNIIRLRRERKITQQELADFIGVTKGSVSKWENQQSLPDILLLPRLAAFFGVTIDELVGYEAQLSPEQIRRCYLEFTKDFANLPFREAMDKVRSFTQRYYACYPFLLQVCVLYLNHYMLAEKEEERRQILCEADALCDRILQGCDEVGVCSDAIAMKAMLQLQLGNAKEVIGMLEPITDPRRLSEENDSMLTHAYQIAGEMEKAKSHAQIRLYLHLVRFIGSAVSFLALCGKEPKRCEETIQRTSGVMELYQIDALHPNLAAQFYYQAAVSYAENGKNKRALECLESFEKCMCRMLEGDCILLHGDAYFDRLEEWISCLPLGAMALRHERFIRKDAQGALAHPAFAGLKKTPEFERICHHLAENK